MEGIYSEQSFVVNVVQQGSVLGPALFLIYIADINQIVLHSVVKSFTDDTRVTKAIKYDADCVCLQEDLNAVYQWSVYPNNMVFNGEKSELLRYTELGEPIEFRYKTLDRLDIDRTNKTTDQGVVILDTANFAEQNTNVATRAGQ